MTIKFEHIARPGRIRDLAPLDRVGWLAEQPEEFQSAVAAVGRWRKVEAGAFLYHAGDPPNGLFGLADGGLDITVPLLSEEPVPIHRAEIGFWIGDSAELSETPQLVSVTAVAPSRVLHVPGPALRRPLEEKPERWRALYRLSARNTATAVRLLSESLSLPVRARVARRLLVLAVRSRDVSITQADLARLVGVTRATLQRCLADLEAAGAVERRYGAVRVLDEALLERFVEAR